MAIDWVREIGPGSGGALDDNVQRRYTRVFLVKTTTPLTGPKEVLLAAGIPRLYAPYVTTLEADLGAYVLGIEPRRDPENAFMWEVTVEYGTRTFSRDGDPSQAIENPTLRPAHIEWGSQEFSRPLVEDVLDFQPIWNSAGQPFDPGIEVDDAYLTLTIERNELVYSAATALAYQNTINADVFFGFAPAVVKCKSITAVRQFEHALWFWRVRYFFQFKQDTWLFRKLDEGYFEYSEGEYWAFLGKEGAPISAPQPLDGEGAFLPDGGTPVFLPFRGYRPVAFAPLGLP